MPSKKLTKPTASDLRAGVKSRKQFFIFGSSKYGQNLVAEIAKANKVHLVTDRDDKFKGFHVIPSLRSSCHRAPLHLMHETTTPTDGDGVATSYYVCVKCKRPCEAV
jgi:hypothetical protein